MKALAGALVVFLLAPAWGGYGAAAGQCTTVEREVERDSTLPKKVGRTELAIVRAASACDFDRLAELAEFAFTEADPLAIVALFDGPVVLDGDLYIWPGTEVGGPRTAISADGAWLFYEEPPPTEVVAVVGTDVVVLSSDDGTVVRTLAEGQVGASTVAVSPDGQTVYFTRADPNVVCDEGDATQVVTVPIGGGEPQVFASGRHPVLSPNGERIAYATGGPDQCGLATQIAIQELDSLTFEQQLYPATSSELDNRIEPLAFSPNSGTLLYRAFSMGAIAAGGTIDLDDLDARPGETGLQNVTDAEYYSRRKLVAVLQQQGDVFVQRLRSTSRGRTLIEFPEVIGYLDLDISRRHIVFTTAGEVWRWSEGGDPVRLLTSDTGNVVGAAWVPTAA